MTEEEQRLAAALGDLSYCPESGVFTWKRSNTNSVKVGDIAGNVSGTGYIQIRHARKNILAHRLGFFAVHGFVPPQVDHINGIKTDNRAENLRAATHAENQRNRRAQMNSATGIKGVSYHKQSGGYCARVERDGKTHSHYINVTKLAATLEDHAVADLIARVSAETIAKDMRTDLHGSFARHE